MRKGKPEQYVGTGRFGIHLISHGNHVNEVLKDPGWSWGNRRLSLEVEVSKNYN